VDIASEEIIKCGLTVHLALRLTPRLLLIERAGSNIERRVSEEMEGPQRLVVTWRQVVRRVVMRWF